MPVRLRIALPAPVPEPCEPLHSPSRPELLTASPNTVQGHSRALTGAAMANAHQVEGAVSPAAWDFYFSTDAAPSGERFEAWRDASRRLVGVEALTDAPGNFEGEYAGRLAGPIAVVRSTTRRSWYERTRALADDGDEVSLTFPGGDHRFHSGDDDVGAIGADNCLFVPHDRPFTLTQLGDRDTSWHLVIERAPLLQLLPSGADIGTRRLDGRDPTLSLIRGYLAALTGPGGAVDAVARNTFGRHMLDLIALVLRPSRDAIEVVEEGGLKAARIKAILDLVERHHRRADLSAAWIGARLGVSARQVHRLLEETPKTLQEHMLEVRLAHAFRRLSDPFGPAAAVSEIAVQCGFASVSHFTRSFRTRFGETPTTVRAVASRDAAARMTSPSLTSH